MQKKSKVVAFRVNDEEYEALTKCIGMVTQEKLEAHIAIMVGDKERDEVVARNVGDVIRCWIEFDLNREVERLRKAKKNAEAAAKRKATKEAKQAANDPQ
jgi:hypothetical protein